ncbi:hypothetical protein HMPREF1544_05065 [Mucor circinelloides 1006PhL]|uniref:MULE transposase domain-containing protein n=1 Tax=Mucor circinelloides f. circinelloides (strain 1006PhL) TaxID=1220926 RepID=S2JCW2_MUCC1|nr:hypothetical protein HMPREF1544_05065 [Mucor circinelloides 1006PhL]
MVHADEIYNLYKKIQEKYYKLAEYQQESIKLWLAKLSEKGFGTFLGADFVNSYTSGFISPWQKLLLVDSSSICLDATHSITTVDKSILYTITTRHPVSGTGCPVAYMFTTDHSMSQVAQFFRFLRGHVGLTQPKPKKITIDVSSAEHGAINKVYPNVNVQWCLFRVARAWCCVEI